jgi:hypothetical protein
MAHDKTNDELRAALAEAANGLARYWRHVASRGVYRVVTLSVREDTLAVDVIYKSEYSGVTWTRPLDEFRVRFEPLGPELWQDTAPAVVPVPDESGHEPRPVLTEADKDELRRILREEYRGTANHGRPAEDVVVMSLPHPSDQTADAADGRAQVAIIRKFAAQPWLAEDALAVLRDTAKLYTGSNLAAQSAEILKALDEPADPPHGHAFAHWLYRQPRLARAVLTFLRLVWPTVVESDHTPTRVRWLFAKVRRVLLAFPNDETC